MFTIRPLALMVILVGLQHGAVLEQVPEDATHTVDVFGNPTRVLTLGLEERGLPADPDLPTAMVLGTLAAEPPPGALSFMDQAFLRTTMEQRVRRFSDWIQGRSNATLIIATEAGHFVHRDDPALAAEAVRRVLAALGGDV